MQIVKGRVGLGRNIASFGIEIAFTDLPNLIGISVETTIAEP
jgi:hypothetical protein